MHQKEIIDSVMNKLQFDNAKTISSDDFSENREHNMIVVGIDTCENVNFGLPDFQYKMTVLIDCLIDQENSGNEFNELCNGVSEILYNYSLDKTKITELFGELNIVYFYVDNDDYTINGNSYRKQYNITIIGSF